MDLKFIVKSSNPNLSDNVEFLPKIEWLDINLSKMSCSMIINDNISTINY